MCECVCHLSGKRAVRERGAACLDHMEIIATRVSIMWTACQVLQRMPQCKMKTYCRGGLAAVGWMGASCCSAQIRFRQFW
uniref:Uncharacterized protein n=1 Tax=Arundo donax TaxID=35708 RepID=A0A0A9ETI2_ARUDO